MATSSIVTSTARLFTASNSEYLSRANASVANLKFGDQDFSIIIFFKMTTKAASGSNNNLVSLYATVGSQRSYELEYRNVSGVDRFYFWISSSGSSPTSVIASTFGSPSTDTWYMAMVRHDATANTIEISINDGSKNSSSHSGGANSSSTADFRIGADMNGNYFNGAISATGIWSRKLTDSEVTNIYNLGAGKFHKDLTDDEKVDLEFFSDMVESSGISYDASSNGYDLTDNNTVTSAAGIITYTAEKAAQFTSANSEYLSVATSGNLAPGDTDFTCTGWFQLDSTGTDRGIVSVLDFGGGFGNNYSWVLFYKASTGKLRFDVDSLGTASTGLHSASSNVAIVTGVPYFFAVRHNATADTIEISVNQEPYVSTAHTGGAYAGTAPFRISAYGITTVTAFWNGRISQVRYFNSALSDALILEQYKRGFGRNYTALSDTTNLVADWALNEVSGNRSDSHGSFTLTDNNTVTQADGVVLYTAPVVGGSTKGGLCLLGVGL